MNRLGRGITDTMASASEEYRRRDERIAMYCGTPDAAQGCRNILAELKDTTIHERIQELEECHGDGTFIECRRRSILQRAITLWGEQSQVMMAIEEMAELTQALSKHYRTGEHAIDMVLEELADARIMLDQLAIIFDRKRKRNLAGYEAAKLDRLDSRITAAEKELHL